MSAGEANPHLISQEYWGVDVTRPAAAPEQAPYQIMSRVGTLATANQLADRLTYSLHDTDREWPHTMLGEFDPTEGEFADGTVLLLERERVVARPSQPDEDPIAAFFRAAAPPIPPIERPFMDYWRRSTTDLFGMGITSIRFEEQELAYEHLLEWGVLRTAADGTRGVAIRPFPHAKVIGDRVKVPSGVKPEAYKRRAVPLPLTTNVTQRIREQDSHTGVTRLLSVNVLRRLPSDGNNRQGGTGTLPVRNNTKRPAALIPVPVVTRPTSF